MTDPQHEETFADTERKLREIITTLRECEARLRAQLAEARANEAALAEIRKTLAAPDDWHPVDAVKALKRSHDRAEAALAAQIEADAEICTYIIKNYDCMKADKETYQPMWVQKVAKGMVSLARQDIRDQPHDRTALDRYREKVLREAYDSLFKHPGFIHAISGQTFRAVKLEDAAEGIIALITEGKKPNDLS